MAYTNTRNGLNIQTASAIDKRIYLTYAEMRTAEDIFMLPDVYLAICANDGKLYLYNVDNEVDPVTGKYRLLDDTIRVNVDGGKIE